MWAEKAGSCLPGKYVKSGLVKRLDTTSRERKEKATRTT